MQRSRDAAAPAGDRGASARNVLAAHPNGTPRWGAIPAELRDVPHWVCWKYEQRDSKPTKVPYNPSTGKKADSRNPRTGAAFQVALASYEVDSRYDGIGFILTDSPFCGIDLDDCIDERGDVESWAADILESTRTYSEITPSGRGLRIIARGALPAGRRRRGQVEMYNDVRFLTITGNRLDAYPRTIHDRTSELAQIHATYLAEDETRRNTAAAGSASLDDSDLLERIRTSNQRHKFEQLWSGNWDGYDSQSEADLALCCILAFWTNRDPNAIDRLFRMSGLCRDKWERQDYRDRTINHALALVTDTYVPHDGAAFSPPSATADAVTLQDFRAYLPEHKFIFMPTGELWPAKSVDERLGTIGKDKASNWLDRNQAVEQMTWAPGEPVVVKDRLIAHGGWFQREGCAVFNLYRPPMIQPGDVRKAQRWIEHVQLIYPGNADHIIRWLAHRVQRPGEKINHALVLGGLQGIGKDTALEPVKHAVGPWNFQEVSPAHLLGRFNGFIKSVVLRVSEARDLGDTDRYAFYEHMKTYTAAPPDVLRCDEKNIREYSVLNVCGVIITTNHKTDGIYLPADDRRHYVAWSEAQIGDFGSTYWTDLYGWFQNGGHEDVATYLAALDITDFDPKAPPEKTPAFWDIVDANRAPEDAELADALDKLGHPSVVTLQMVVGKAEHSFGEWLRDRRNSRQIPHRMEAAGYVRVRNESAKDGLWKVGDKRQTVYAQQSLSVRDRLEAADELVRGIASQ